MAKLTATTGAIQIDDGVYDATLLSIDLAQATAKSPNQNPFLKWIFHVYDSEEGQELSAASSLSFGPKAKAREWVEAIEGKKLQPGEEIDTETFCPKECQVVIKNDPDSGFARVDKVLGIRRRQAPKRQAVSAAADDGVAI